MSRPLTIGLIASGVLAVVLLFSVLGYRSGGIALQESVVAQYRDNQNKYDAFWKSVVEVAQIPAQYKEDFKTLVVSETSAKFGPQGSQATMQWFKERNLVLPAEMYTRVQTTIEVGRADFKNGQQSLLDKQRAAKTYYKGSWGSFCRTLGGDWLEDLEGELKPPKDLDGDGRYTVFDYDIVTSARTKAAFATGEDGPVKVFGESGRHP